MAVIGGGVASRFQWDNVVLSLCLTRRRSPEKSFPVIIISTWAGWTDKCFAGSPLSDIRSHRRCWVMAELMPVSCQIFPLRPQELQRWVAGAWWLRPLPRLLSAHPLWDSSLVPAPQIRSRGQNALLCHSLSALISKLWVQWYQRALDSQVPVWRLLSNPVSMTDQLHGLVTETVILGPQAQEGSWAWFGFCYHGLEILSNFKTMGLAFSFCNVPYTICSWSHQRLSWWSSG